MISIYISKLKGNQATYVQIAYYNNGCSASSYSINVSNNLVINMNLITGSPQLYASWQYMGVL